MKRIYYLDWKDELELQLNDLTKVVKNFCKNGIIGAFYSLDI